MLIAEVWAEALQIDVSTIGVHDNFFDIGGHSLLAMRVISGIFDRTGARLSPRIIVLSSLEHIAGECEQAAVEDSGANAPANNKPSLVTSVLSKLLRT